MRARSRNSKVRQLQSEELAWFERVADTMNTEIKSEADLLPPGASIGTVPSDLEQATGLERLEILGKMQGVDIFDMKPLDASRKGTKRVEIPRYQPTKSTNYLRRIGKQEGMDG
jgi:hypothetical protein